jgi:hypothetical protein
MDAVNNHPVRLGIVMLNEIEGNFILRTFAG